MSQRVGQEGKVPAGDAQNSPELSAGDSWGLASELEGASGLLPHTPARVSSKEAPRRHHSCHRKGAPPTYHTV